MVIILALFFVAYLEGTALTVGGTVTQTTVQTSTPTQTEASQSQSTSETTSQTVVTGATQTSHTSTISPAVLASGIAKMNQTTLNGLVNRTGVTFSLSTTSLPYVVVTDNRTGKILGLVYLTTDVALESSYGFDGPIGILVYVNTSGTIEGVRLWSIFDSYGIWGSSIVGSSSWYTSPVLHAYLNSFVNRSVFQPLQVGNDVQGIAQATFTSTGVASGIRDGGRAVVEDFQSATAQPGTGQVSFLISIFGTMNASSALTVAVVLGLFTGALLAFWSGRTWAKYVVFFASIAFLGLYAGRMVSIGDLPIFLTGYFPPLGTNLFWYVLYCGVLVTSLVWGRIYCGYLCPFGAVTELLNAISPLKVRMPEAIHRRLVYLKYATLILAVALVLGAIRGVEVAPGFFDVEPFSTLFLSIGDVIAFVFLGAVLVASALFTRFYCSYICPAGAGLSILGRLRVREIKRWPECQSCRVCEAGCPTGAISHGRISTLECMNCRKCEANFLNTSICPHYALGRKGGSSL